MIHKRTTSAALCALVLTSAACATGGGSVEAADIPRLEREITRDPGDVETATRLGVAYYNAGRHTDARDALTQVVQSPDAPAAAYLYLGLAHEASGDWAAARAAYTSYLDRGEDSPMRDRIRGRIALVVRNELRQSARAALAREAALADQPPTPRSVAVFPLRLIGAPAEYEPLQTALADMMITDLQLSGALRVLERVQVQALLEEMTLTAAGYTEQATGARAGRLLRAEHVVQSALTATGGDAVRMDAAVVPTGDGQRAELTGTAGSIERIIELEKQAVFDILASLNVQLTAAEREKINENRTGSLLALLAYGRGLQAVDRGDYSGALVEFQQAAQLDPAFDRASEQQSEASTLQTASATSTAEVAQQASTEVSTGATVEVATVAKNVVNDINPSPSTTQTQQIAGQTSTQETPPQTGTNPGTTRNPVQEAQGQEGVSAAPRAKFQFVIRNPTRSGT